MQLASLGEYVFRHYKNIDLLSQFSVHSIQPIPSHGQVTLLNRICKYVGIVRYGSYLMSVIQVWYVV